MKKFRTLLITFVLLALLLAGEGMITPVQAAPATFTDSGSTLLIDLGAGEQLTIFSNGTTYTFQTNQTFANGGVTNPGSDFSAFGGASITLTASGLTRYDAISITDSGAGASVIFGDSGADTFSDSFTIVIDAGSSTVTVANSVTIVNGGSLSITADAINLNADVTTAGGQTYNSPVTLGANMVAESTTNGDIAFNSTINGLFSLTVNTGGVTSFLGTIGIGGDRLGSLTTDAGGSTAFNISGGTEVDIQNDAFFGDNVAISGGGQRWELRGDTTFDGTVSGPDTILIPRGILTFNDTGTFAGLQIANLGQTVINGGSITTTSFGMDFFNDVILGADTVLTSNGLIRFRDTLDGAFALTLNAPGATEFEDVVGGITPLTSLTTDASGTTRLEGGELNLSGNTLTFNDPVTLTTDTVINDAGAITFNDTVDGAFALTVDAGDDVTFGGAVGGATPLASLDATSDGEIFVNAAITTADGDVILSADAMSIAAAIDAGAAIVTLAPNTAGQLIDLGGVDAVGTLGLTDAEIDLITASTLRIGSSDAGSITFTDTISPVGTNTLSLITGDAVVDDNNGADVQVANLALQAVNGIASFGGDVLLETEVETIAALNTTSGGISLLETFSGSDLIVGAVDGVVGIRNEASTGFNPILAIQLETTNGDLTVNSDIFNQRRNIFLVAQQGNGGSGDSLFTNNANISAAAANSQIEIRANNMTLAGGSTISAPDRVILEDDPSSTATVAINLGGGDGVNTLGLTDAELNTVSTTGILQIGQNGTGNIDVTAAIDLTDGPSIPTTDLISGAAVGGSSGNVLAANTLNVTAGAGIGASGDPFAVNATQLTTAGSGDQYLAETDSVTIGGDDLNAGAGNAIQLAGGTFLTTSSGGAIQNNTTVLSGATLGGAGAVNGTVTAQSGGTVAPGASPGLIDTGSVDFTAGSNFNVEVNGLTGAGTDYDQLNVAGSVTIDSAANLVASGTIMGTTSGAEIIIINNDGADPVSGNFAGLPAGAPLSINGQAFRISYAGGDGNDVTLIENTAPALTAFTRQNPAASPTNADSLVFRATFSEAVQNVDSADFDVNSTTTATVAGVSPVSADTYDITVSGGDLADFDGVVGLDLSGAQDIQDLAGNALPAGEPATDETYTLDNTALTVTINQATTQPDPTNTASIDFIAAFDQAPVNFIAADVTLGGTASGVLSATLSGGPTVYTVTVAGMTGAGVVTAAIEAGAVTDLAGNGNTASTSTDNEVTFDPSTPSAGSLTAADITIEGGATYSFTVVYSDDLAIDVGSLDGNDIRVTGPGGFDQPATLLDVTPAGNGTPRTATYQITAPGGSWDLADNGAYTVILQDNQVGDTAGNFVPGGTLGAFDVAIIKIFLPLIYK